MQFLLNRDGSTPAGADLDALTRLGVLLVVPTDPPIPEPGMVAVEAEPTNIDGTLYQTWVQVPAPALQEALPVTQLTHVEFMDRFSSEELEQLYALENTVPKVKVWLKRFELASFIDLADPRTIDGVRGLEDAQLLATGRADQILGITSA